MLALILWLGWFFCQGLGSWVSGTAILALGGIVGCVAGVLAVMLLNACQKLPEMPSATTRFQNRTMEAKPPVSQFIS